MCRESSTRSLWTRACKTIEPDDKREPCELILKNSDITSFARETKECLGTRSLSGFTSRGLPSSGLSSSDEKQEACWGAPLRADYGQRPGLGPCAPATTSRTHHCCWSPLGEGAPLPRSLSTLPSGCVCHLFERAGDALGMPSGVGRFDGYPRRYGALVPSSSPAAVFPVEGSGDTRAKQPRLLACTRNQWQSDLERGSKSRIVSSRREMMRRGIWLDLQRGSDRGSAHRLVRETTPSSPLPTLPRYWRPTGAVG